MAEEIAFNKEHLSKTDWQYKMPLLASNEFVLGKRNEEYNLESFFQKSVIITDPRRE